MSCYLCLKILTFQIKKTKFTKDVLDKKGLLLI